MFSSIKTYKAKTDSKAIANNISKKTNENSRGEFRGIQTKLSIGQANDKYEQEADRVADRVMTMPSLPTGKKEPAKIQKNTSNSRNTEIQTQTDFQGITPLIQRQPEEEEEEAIQPKLIQKQEEEEETLQAKLGIQRQEEPEEEEEAEPEEEEKEEEEEHLQAKTNTNSPQKVSSSTESSINQSKGRGSPIPEETRSFMENRFGADFGQVRVHNDSNAVQLNKQLNSHAFTKGSDIYFNSGKFDPVSFQGKHLLAHELTHTIQQNKKGNNVQRWAPSTHEELTKKGIKEIQAGLNTVDDDAVNSLAKYATGMDFKFPELWFNFIGKIKGSRISLRGKERRVKSFQKHYAVSSTRAKNHGEGGLYTYPLSKGTGINLAHQINYEKKAENVFKTIPHFWKSISECDAKKSHARNEVFEILGDALHVAQDRGSHGEGAIGKGHAGEVFTGKSPDEPENNKKGYRQAQHNTAYVLIRALGILIRLLDKKYKTTCSTIRYAKS